MAAEEGPPLVVAAVVSVQPGANPAIQEKVHGILRNGYGCVKSTDAWEYAASLPGPLGSRYAGYHQCVAPRGSSAVCCAPCLPVCGVYFFDSGDNCICGLIPLLIPVWCGCCHGWICSGGSSVSNNAFLTRDKNGTLTGTIFMLDHERSTIAIYGVKCCTSQLQEDPQCYLVK